MNTFPAWQRFRRAAFPLWFGFPLVFDQRTENRSQQIRRSCNRIFSDLGFFPGHNLEETAEEAKAAHIVFFAGDAKPELIEPLNSAGVLTVGDTTGSWDQGGMIEMREVKGRIRFAINLKRAKDVIIQIKPQLLRLAVEVRKQAGWPEPPSTTETVRTLPSCLSPYCQATTLNLSIVPPRT